MKSIRRGLWDGEVGKDARGRFSCRICRESLTPSEVAVSGESPDTADAVDAGESPENEEAVRSCPECGRSWRATAPRWRTTGG